MSEVSNVRPGDGVRLVMNGAVRADGAVVSRGRVYVSVVRDETMDQMAERLPNLAEEWRSQGIVRVRMIVSAKGRCAFLKIDSRGVAVVVHGR